MNKNHSHVKWLKFRKQIQEEKFRNAAVINLIAQFLRNEFASSRTNIGIDSSPAKFGSSQN
jgi:hypothetical protein